MRSEDIDWKIYHIIADKGGITPEGIVRESGYDAGLVSSSLSRLNASLLISRRGSGYTICSLEEYMLQSQIKHDPCSSITIENGIIRVKDMQGK